MGKYKIWVVVVFCLVVALPVLADSHQVLEFSVNSNVAVVDGIGLKMPKPSIQIGEETYVPVEFLSDKVEGVSVEKISEGEQSKLELNVDDRFGVVMPLDDYNIICQIAGILGKYVDLNLCDVVSEILENEDELTDDEIKALLTDYYIQADSYITKKFTTYKWDYLFESLKYQLEKMSDELEDGKLIGLATKEKTGGYLEVALIALNAQDGYCPNIPMIEYPFYAGDEKGLYKKLEEGKALVFTTLFYWNAGSNNIIGLMEAINREFGGEVSVVTSFLTAFDHSDHLEDFFAELRGMIDDGWFDANTWLKKNGFETSDDIDISHTLATFIDRSTYRYGASPLGIEGQKTIIIVSPDREIIWRGNFDRINITRDDYELVHNAVQKYLDSLDEGGES